MATGRDLIMNLLKNSIEKVEKSQTEVDKPIVSESKEKPSKERIKSVKKVKEKEKKTEEKAKPVKNKPIVSESKEKPSKERIKSVKKVKEKEKKTEEKAKPVEKKEAKNKKEKVKSNKDGEPSEPEPTWNLTKDRLVKLRKFKGETYVDIREYYMDKLSWEIKPGQKGVSLNLEQYKSLKSILPQLDLVFPAQSDQFVDPLA
eukprot:GFUD01037779.1.p1 GENE.GFUD01037779.1~~GFUD01037779.1.p1  ORF type:complete len:202 (+),score=88.49 GFUD01037779.1:55-660(+)